MSSEHVAIDSTLPFQEIETRDRQRIVTEHTPRSLIAFFVVVTYGGVIEWMTRPRHHGAIVLAATLYVVITAVCLILLRLRPRWAVPIAVGAVSALSAAMLTYSPMVRGGGELCVLAVTVLLAGFTMMFPLGLRNQLLASIVPVTGCVMILYFGGPTAYPTWYSCSALAVMLFVLAIGARSIDRYRSRILWNAFREAALARENARLRDEANAANHAKSELMSILAHELRTPLTSIRIFNHLLLDRMNIQADESRAIMQRVSDQSRRALDLVQTMLEYGSIASGRLQVSVAEFDVAEMIDGVRTDLPAVWHRPNVRLSWDTPLVGVRMRTDRGKVEAILRNLVHNALKHTTMGSISVTATSEPARKAVRFAVSDTGEGIAKEALPQIFDSFARATSAGEGFGLGLFIVKRFAEVLGGEVSVQSTPGLGTRFDAIVPLDVTPRQAAEARAA